MRDSDAFSLGALYAAAMRAARGKRHRPPVARFLLELEPALCTLRQELVTGTWRPGVPRLLSVRDPKPRTISVAPFRDHVVHQALAAVLAPRIERRLVSDSYACRPGLGTHAALARGRAWANRYLDPVDHLVKDRLRVRAYLPTRPRAAGPRLGLGCRLGLVVQIDEIQPGR